MFMTSRETLKGLEEIADLEHFDPANVSDTLSETAQQVIDTFKEKIFVISSYKTIKMYDDFIETLLKAMAEGFEFKDYRNHNVAYRFYDPEEYDPEDFDTEVRYLPFKVFITNVILWRAQVALDNSGLGPHLIIPTNQMNKITKSFIKKYLDDNYIRRYKNHIPYHDVGLSDINRVLNEIMCDTTFKLSRISSIFNQFIGISFSIETFIDMEKRLPEYKEVMDFVLDTTLQPAEMEEQLGEMQKKMFRVISEDEEYNMLKPLIIKGSGLNPKQFRDMSCNIGLKPDEDGSTMPDPINTNYLNKGGLYSPEFLYENSISGRKAAIINVDYMGKTGHLLILVAINTAGATLSHTTMDCGSPNPIEIEIKTPEHLRKLHGRRYRFPGQKEYHILNMDDTHLLGETLYFRSPITCACKDGVCRECYGDLYYTNIDNNNQGIFSATIVMNPVVQGILSAKHHQTTNSSMIKFREEFDKFFSISSTDIILADMIDDIMSYSLIIRREDINTVDGDDSELDFTVTGKRSRKKKQQEKKPANNAKGDDFGINIDDDGDFVDMGLKYYTTKFSVVKHLNHKDPTKREYIEFEDIDSKELYIHEDFINKMVPGQDDKGLYLGINLEMINPEDFVFIVDVENNELTKPMKQIQRLINNKDHEGCNSYEELVSKMLELMIASNIKATSVHAEMIIRQLVADANNVLKRPDFSRIIMRKDYQLLTITTALKKNASITTSMSTPYLKSQLIDLAETFEKKSQGIFDPLFKLTLNE